MQNRTTLVVALCAAALLSGCVRGRPSEETFTWKGPVKSDTWLRLRNTSGDFDVKQGTSDSAEIQLKITRSSAAAPTAQVKVLQTADGILACVLFGETNSCSADEYKGGNASTRSPLPWMRGSTKVSGTVVLPRGVKLDVESVNGDITVGSIARDLKVSTVNGDIAVKGSRGVVDMSTTNGDINADLYAMAGKVKFATTNGSIEVTMPETLNAALNMRTVNGDLDFGLPATITKKSKREITATLGQGGSPIEIETTNGSISVKPGGAP